MEWKKILPKAKAKFLFDNYSKNYAIDIVETKIKVLIADNNELELSFWRKVLHHLENEHFHSDPIKYRIQNSDGTLLNAGTGLDSWFTLETARKLVDYNIGQKIVESDGVNILWEVL